MTLFSHPGVFRPWLYTVSHTTLLVRGEGVENGRNIDLIFAGVEYMEILPRYESLTITRPTDEEAFRLLKRLEEACYLESLFALTSRSERTFIVATYFLTDVNDCEASDNRIMGQLEPYEATYPDR